MARRWFGLVVAGAALVLVAAACGNTAEGASGGDGGGLSGAVVGDGSSTVFPITQAVAEEFTARHPDVQVSVGVSGTGGGFEKFCAGETDIQDASRPIEQDEIDRCAANGVEYVELKVALDGISVVVNPANDWATCLTVDQLGAIWEPGSRIDDWSEIPGGGFPSHPLTLYGPGTDSGTFDYFTDVIVGEEGASRSDYTASEDDNVLVQGVAGDERALGYFGYAYYEENRDRLKVLGVDAGQGCVTPSQDTIRSGAYAPLSRPLFVYVAEGALSKPQVVAFVDFYLQVAPDLVPQVGYVNISEADREAMRQAWADFRAAAS
ncbi:MAG TPA: PstS family phosphate ABC transporter substrate-binding protein [Actinomycetota bacterium]|nr:PstS family phosphate ABC transporter substrate-binding protein [Actinomycetota bacterium]